MSVAAHITVSICVGPEASRADRAAIRHSPNLSGHATNPSRAAGSLQSRAKPARHEYRGKCFPSPLVCWRCHGPMSTDVLPCASLTRSGSVQQGVAALDTVAECCNWMVAFSMGRPLPI